MSERKEPLRLLVYTARYRGAELASDLEDILAKSSRNNARDGITGALLVDGPVFVQAVEGPALAIADLYARICADARCGNPEVLLDRPALGRSAWGWSLAVARLDADPGIDPAALRAFRDAYISGFKADAAGFIELLHALLDRSAHRTEPPAG